MDNSQGVGSRFPHLLTKPISYAKKAKASAPRIFPGYHTVFVINQTRWGRLKSSVKGLFNGAHLGERQCRKALVSEGKRVGMIKDGKYSHQLTVLRTMLAGRVKLYGRFYPKLNREGRQVHNETITIIVDTIKKHSGGVELSDKDRLKILTHIRGLDSMFGYHESPDIASFNRRFPVKSGESRSLNHSESKPPTHGESMRS